jgi:hypothetical protein
MSTTLAPQNPLSYMGVKPPRPPNVITDNRAPTTLDTNYDLGTMWVDTTTPQVYFLAEVSGNTATWLPLGGGGPGVQTLTGNSGGMVPPTAGNINVVGDNASGIDVVGNPGTSTLTIFNTLGPVRFPITPYVVGPVGEAGYQTIQAALDAANAAGGGIVYVQPGTYTENLTLYGDTQVVGVPGNPDSGTAGNSVIISGVHTPPTTGSFVFANVRLASATDIFNSAAAGSASLVLENCFIAITNGFIFNLTNWTGAFVVYNLGDGSTNNGVVTNTGGAVCFFVSATLGAGTGQTMVTSGAVNLQELDLRCPWDAQTGTTIEALYNFFSATTTLSANSTGSFSHCRWSTGATPAITMSSSGAISLMESIIDSSNVPAISGAGAGILSYADLIFVADTTFAGTLTLAPLNWQPYSTAGNTATAVRGTSGFDSNDFIVTDGFVQLAGSSGFTWNEVVVMGPTSMVANNGYVANNAGLVTLTLPVTAAFGTVIRVAGKGGGGWLIAQNAGQTIHFGVVDTSTGAGGSLESTDQYDAVELLCTEADTDWTVLSVIGNLTVT